MMKISMHHCAETGGMKKINSCLVSITKNALEFGIGWVVCIVK